MTVKNIFRSILPRRPSLTAPTRITGVADMNADDAGPIPRRSYVTAHFPIGHEGQKEPCELVMRYFPKAPYEVVEQILLEGEDRRFNAELRMLMDTGCQTNLTTCHDNTTPILKGGLDKVKLSLMKHSKNEEWKNAAGPLIHNLEGPCQLKELVECNPAENAESERPSSSKGHDLKHSDINQELVEKTCSLEKKVLKLETQLSVYQGYRKWVEDGVSKEFIELDPAYIDEAIRDLSPFAKGGFGVVYKVRIQGTDVALKVPWNVRSLDNHAAFCKEAMILKGIQHPNLITLIGACTKRCILAYEYMPGGTLEDRLLSGKEATFSWFHRVNVAFDVCCALVFLHSTKPVPIVHGDLKPSNVLLDETGCAKLSDFGISRHLYNTTDSGTPSHLTDNPKGSGCYMDPSFTKTKVLTTSADTFAFGIMVLELLTGFGGAGLRKYAADKALSISNFSKERKEKTICKVKVAVPQWNSHDESRSIALEMLDVGLRCSSKERQGRPDLELEVWPVVKAWHETACRYKLQEAAVPT